MRHYRLAIATALSLGAVHGGAAAAQSADDIIRMGVRIAEDRTHNVENYTIRQRMGPTGEAPVYFERDSVEGRVFILVPPHVIMKRAAEEMGCDMSSLEDLNMQTVMQKAGFGNALDQMTAPDDDEAPVIVDPLAAADLEGRARLLGTETVDGRETYVLEADDLEGIEFANQETEKGGFVIDKLTVYVDVDEYVSRRAVIEGEMEYEGRNTPIRMVSEFSDYRHVDDMYHPFLTTVRTEGFMGALSDKDRKQMEEAKKGMADMERQLAQLPEAQRRMVESQLKGQMDKMMQMFEGDGFEISIEVVELLVNAGPPPEWAPEVDEETAEYVCQKN